MGKIWRYYQGYKFIIGEDPNGITDNSGITSDMLYSYPNPVNEFTTIKFKLAETSSISLNIYNSLGHLVANLASGTKESGEYTINWDVDKLPSGVYYGILENHSNSKTGRIVILKE